MAEVLLHLVSCAFMTGLIWVIQILHYPVFADIREDQFTSFHLRHSRKISVIVGPVMVIELVTALLLTNRFPHDSFLILNLVILIFTWIMTAFHTVPLHQALSTQQDPVKIRQLVFSNWFRTVAWTVRLFILMIYFSRLLLNNPSAMVN